MGLLVDHSLQAVEVDTGIRREPGLKPNKLLAPVLLTS